MLIAGAEVGGTRLDVRLARGVIVELGRALAPEPEEPRLDAAGGALLPGLHDHHVHVLALAAAADSVRCGPPEVGDEAALERALAGAGDGAAWVRGVGYHESVAGELDRSRLDRFALERPLRIQHRSGALWMLNSAAVERVGLDRGEDAAGVERDARGRATGRLFRLDDWLRERLDATAAPDLAVVGRRLARFGVTGLTDATPGNGPAELSLFERAVERGDLPQRLVLMGAPELPPSQRAGIERGAVKVLLRDEDLPEFDDLTRTIDAAHQDGRAVAVHCVSRAELVLAASAFSAAGCRAGDRIEHAAVAPPDVVELVAALPLTVVTQPGFVRERGDAYALDVEARDQPWLYRGLGFLEAGVPLGGGTDAPFGDPDPWRAMRAAVERRTASGLCLGARERLEPERALALFTSPPELPGAAPRRVAPGSPADLCLLDRPWTSARRELSSEHVAATLRAGRVIFRR
ncbi:MAG: amidohydrolase family protein [Myxococcota bacterium]